MLWTDLEAGDVIRIKDEVAQIFHNDRGSVVWNNCDKDLTIVKVVIKHGYIGVYVGNFKVPFHIDINGFVDWVDYRGILFDIVSLKEN